MSSPLLVTLSRQTNTSRKRGHSFSLQLESSKPRTRMMRTTRFGLLGLTAGIIFGFVLCLWTTPIICLTNSECCLRAQLHKEIQQPQEVEVKVSEMPKAGTRKQVLIGVMTAASLVDTRAKTVYETWAKTINGDVIFFSSEATPERIDLPVVPLPGVDDTYPPQKKSFMLLKYLHDYGIDKYDFFMRVDDDVYIQGSRLSDFLSQLNSSEPLYIGQAGLGRKDELGQLSLSHDENFCMGGPGMIFSGVTLRKVIPHLSYCLQHLRTSHEDVELGRCIRMFAGIPCTWNYEAQKLFYHSFAPKEATVLDLTKSALDEAITMHALKNTDHMIQTHRMVSVKELARFEAKQDELERELTELDALIDDPSEGHTLIKEDRNNREDLHTWTYITKKHQYEHSSFSVKRNLYIQRRHSLNESVAFVKHQLSEELSSQNLVVDGCNVNDLKYGYERYHPINGIEQVLTLDMRIRKIRGRTHTSSVSKTVKLRRPFGKPFIREVSTDYNVTVHMILPLSGRFKVFTRFLRQFELVCGDEKANCKLAVILYETDEAEETYHAIVWSKYKDQISVIRQASNFSRAHALHLGVTTLSKDSLALFIDVDMHFTSESMSRVRQHTKLGKQAYFPIVFSQYDSQMVCNSNQCPVTDLSSDSGAFRYFGFGIASMYKSDYLTCGGFDLSIHGWGKEDVDLYTKVLRSNTIDVFRSADPSLVHIYHPVICEANLNRDQAIMCLNSKAASFASKRLLAQIYYSK